MSEWFRNSLLFGSAYKSFSNGKINTWLNNPSVDLYIKFSKGKMAGTIVRVIRDPSYRALDDWCDTSENGRGNFGRNLKLKVFDGKDVKTISFSTSVYDSNTVSGAAFYCICDGLDPNKPNLGEIDTDTVYPLRQDMFGIDIQVGSVVHVQIYNMGIFAVVEKYNPKSLQIKPIEWNNDLETIFHGKSIAWNRNTNECFVIDKSLSDRLLMARLASGE